MSKALTHRIHSFDPGRTVETNAQVTTTLTSAGMTDTVTTFYASIYTFAALVLAVFEVAAAAVGLRVQTKEDVVLNKIRNEGCDGFQHA
jgi:hypothetical protein